MDITLRFIGKVKEAHISLNGITVIAGENSSGKTTIAKALYGSLSPFENLERSIFDRKIQSMAIYAQEWFQAANKKGNTGRRENIILTSLYLFGRRIPGRFKEFKLLNPDSDITEEFLIQAAKEYSRDRNPITDASILSNEATNNAIKAINQAYARNDMDYAKLVFEQSLVGVFSNQVATFGNFGKSTIQLGETNLEFGKTNFSIQNFLAPSEYKVSTVVYLPASRFSHRDEDFLKGRLLKQLGSDSALLDLDFTLEQHESIRENQVEFSRLVDTIIKGHLERTESGFVFVEDSHPSDQIALDNVASGVLPFAYIGRLVMNGMIREDTILIIDEPEMNLHPEWQLQFARLLVFLSKKVGVRTVIISHSPYFIRAVEKTLATEGNGVDGRFYLMKEQDKLFISSEVTNSMKEIYTQLYRPFEEL